MFLKYIYLFKNFNYFLSWKKIILRYQIAVKNNEKFNKKKYCVYVLINK